MSVLTPSALHAVHVLDRCAALTAEHVGPALAALGLARAASRLRTDADVRAAETAAALQAARARAWSNDWESRATTPEAIRTALELASRELARSRPDLVGPVLAELSRETFAAADAGATA